METDDDNGDEIDRNQSSVPRTMLLLASHTTHTWDEIDTPLISQYVFVGTKRVCTILLYEIGPIY